MQAQIAPSARRVGEDFGRAGPLRL